MHNALEGLVLGMLKTHFFKNPRCNLHFADMGLLNRLEASYESKSLALN
jgi:hypothetical protein